MPLEIEKIFTFPTGGPGVTGVVRIDQHRWAVAHWTGVDLWNTQSGKPVRFAGVLTNPLQRGLILWDNCLLFPTPLSVLSLSLDQPDTARRHAYPHPSIPLPYRKIMVLAKHPTEPIAAMGLVCGYIIVFALDNPAQWQWCEANRVRPILAIDFCEHWVTGLSPQAFPVVWDWQTQQKVFTCWATTKHSPTAIRFHPKGHLAIGHTTGTVRVFPPPHKRHEHRYLPITLPALDQSLLPGPYTIRSMAWQGDRLWVGTKGGLLLWTEPFEPEPTWKGSFAIHQQAIEVLDVMDDCIITGGMDGFAYVFQAQETVPAENDHQTSALASNPTEMP